MQTRGWLGIGLALALAATVVLGGCKDQQLARSKIQITSVALVDEQNPPPSRVFLIDVLTDSTVYEDDVFVTVENKPASGHLHITPSGPFGSVRIDHFRVEYDIPGEEMEPIEGDLNLLVPSGSSAVARITLISALAKVSPPLVGLIGTLDELFGTATITLSGTEETSEERLTATAQVSIHIADWADED